MFKLIRKFISCIGLLLLTINCYALPSSDPIVGLVFNDQQGKQVATPLLSSDVNMNINGLINRVTVKQIFKNETEQWINANYIFPLPDKSAVDHLRLKIGERIIEGDIKPIEQATKIYQEAKQAGKKASLLTQQRSNIFTTQVANIAPFETVTVEIEYQDSILYRDGQFSLHYPMTITPRYSPAKLNIEQDDFLLYASSINANESDTNIKAKKSNELSPWQQQQLENKINTWINAKENTQLAEKTAKTIAPNQDPKLLMNVKVNIISSIPLKEITSHYHKINLQQKDKINYQVNLNEPVIADHDFVLSWETNEIEQNKVTFYHQQSNNQRYGQLMFLPAQSHNKSTIDNKIFNKDILFVIDTSGSMSGSSIDQAKQALQYGIEQLNPSDRFNIIDFNNEAKLFTRSFINANTANKQIADAYINHMQASGGTNMEDALSLALATKPQGKKRIQQIIFITDASISNEDQLLEKIQTELEEQRLFMVAIGSAPNRYFMTRSATFGKGTYTYIGKIEEVKDKISSLFRKIDSPVLQDISITWEDGTAIDYWPKNMSDLYQSEPLQVVMKIPNNGNKKDIIINAIELQKGKKSKWRKVLKITEKQSSQGISQLWAREKIDDISLNKQYLSEEKRALITELAMQHHLVTKYTSLVAVDKTPVRPIHKSSKELHIRNNLPNGSQQKLPQTGFVSDWLIKNALIMQLIGLFLWLIVIKKGFKLPKLVLTSVKDR